MDALDPAAQASNGALVDDADMTFAQRIEGVIRTIEHLAVAAAHAEEPCARILFSTANLLRVSVPHTLR
ncbi:hypothetical protein [Roseomonas haemaphysalidis]|uniref:Uncharacterized protein n=1 Tax=Roseomonas haemaphysalidis TaxID=2768162 RepID=A0ABS3KY52_9PROT|nr:hypothetical protein [Roseomonas haemaphysalidis]MBO1081860.1 hypothetical protein [Roseomonas haemaphysalidis]